MPYHGTSSQTLWNLGDDCTVIYDFILYRGPENADRLLVYAKQTGIQLISSFNEGGGSIVIRAAFPPRTLRQFQENFPAGWFKKVC